MDGWMNRKVIFFLKKKGRGEDRITALGICN